MKQPDRLPLARFVVVVAFFAGAFFLAVVTAAFGFIALLLGTEVVPEPTAGPLVGPTMTGMATAGVISALIAIGIRLTRVRIGSAVIAALAGYLLFVVTGAVLLMFEHGSVIEFVLVFGNVGVSLPALTVALAGFVVGLGFQVVVVARANGAERPRWPWERE